MSVFCRRIAWNDLVHTQSHLPEHSCDVFTPPRALCDNISLAAPLQNDDLNFMPLPASALCSAMYSMSAISSASDHWALAELVSGGTGASGACGGLLLRVCIMEVVGSGAWECVTSCDTSCQNPKQKFYFVAGWALSQTIIRSAFHFFLTAIEQRTVPRLFPCIVM